MSGHSKWSTIKNKKEKTDAARAKIFTKLSKEIYVAVKNFGNDLETNRKLRDLILKAKANNVPYDNIERIIKKASGDVNKNNYESVFYEGYGPKGVAILIETLTDNRNRTSSNLKHYFDKFNGKLATTGCVSFMFNNEGIIKATKTNLHEEQEHIMETCLNFEINDFNFFDNVIELKMQPTKLNLVTDELIKKNFTILCSEIVKTATNKTNLTNEDDLQNFYNLISILNDDDDVQQVWHNLNE